ncbi:MAG: P-II family nitrogen regulator [Dehalococcoidales bacterium]|nr:P-II family nitrogen regulator [Dehalococcoidales bacterium]
MKKIEAIIREERLENVKKALEDGGYFAMTVTEVSGRGEQLGLTLPWRVGEYRVDLLPKLKLEIVAPDKEVDTIVNTIIENARTGEIGDGKIFIIPVDNAIRVRTGEQGDIAINKIIKTKEEAKTR